MRLANIYMSLRKVISRYEQIFYFIRPTPANLAAYERWSGTEIQNHSWLGDMCDEVFKVELTAGNTMIIPTGWIHAVVSPCHMTTCSPFNTASFSILPWILWFSEATSCTHTTYLWVRNFGCDTCGSSSPCLNWCTELKVREIENATHVPRKFRFPFFTK